jgi:hypothetical protein
LKNELYFPTPRELNDPAEARPKVMKPTLDALIAALADKSGMQKPHLNTRRQAKEAAMLRSTHRGSVSTQSCGGLRLRFTGISKPSAYSLCQNVGTIPTSEKNTHRTIEATA